MKIEAATRIKTVSAAQQVLAADANEKKAIKYLTEVGFTGLTLKSSGDNVIKFKFESYDKKKLEKTLGKPKASKSEDAGAIRYDIPGAGVVAVWPAKDEVMMKNSKRN